jgi:hypothetical protein
MAHKFPELEHEAPLRADAGRVCFADEVAIDFPSVRPAVERMRNAFLGATSEPPVRLEVVLSRTEALLGGDVRVEVPIRRTCAACGGRGEVWNDLCEACEGVGHAAQRQLLEVAMPPGMRDGARVCLTVSPRQAPVTRVELHVMIK